MTRWKNILNTFFHWWGTLTVYKLFLNFKPFEGLLYDKVYNHTCLLIKDLHQLYIKRTSLFCNMHIIIKIHFLQNPHRYTRKNFSKWIWSSRKIAIGKVRAATNRDLHKFTIAPEKPIIYAVWAGNYYRMPSFIRYYYTHIPYMTTCVRNFKFIQHLNHPFY